MGLGVEYGDLLAGVADGSVRAVPGIDLGVVGEGHQLALDAVLHLLEELRGAGAAGAAGERGYRQRRGACR